jgi:integrase
MALTELTVRNVQPGKKAFKMMDEKGLYLHVWPSGSKYWRMKYRFGGKEHLLAFGVYPYVSLREARRKRDEARMMILDNINPAEQKRTGRLGGVKSDNTFEAVTREWHEQFASKWTKSYAEKLTQRFEKDVFPWIGARPISEIRAPEILNVLRRIEKRGANETAHKIHQNCGQVFRYAVATGRVDRDPSRDLKGALTPVRQTHYASVTEPNAVGELLRAIEGYHGTPETYYALKLAPLVFVRPGELRRAEWKEIDFERAEWRIPAEKMKMRTVHVVPLSSQSIEILKSVQVLTGNSRYVFPGARSNDRPMSENTINAALRRLGYDKEEMTGHGFRSMASTLLNEMGWNGDAIERQLAHCERNGVRAAYNYAEHLPERRKMMQAWADYLDSLKAGAKVIPMRH